MVKKVHYIKQNEIQMVPCCWPADGSEANLWKVLKTTEYNKSISMIIHGIFVVKNKKRSKKYWKSFIFATFLKLRFAYCFKFTHKNPCTGSKKLSRF